MVGRVIVVFEPFGAVSLARGTRWAAARAAIVALLCLEPDSVRFFASGGLIDDDAEVGAGPLAYGSVVQVVTGDTLPRYRDPESDFRIGGKRSGQRALSMWFAPIAAPSPAPERASPTAGRLAATLLPALTSVFIAFVLRQPIFALFGASSALAAVPTLVPRRRAQVPRLGSRRDSALMARSLVAARSATSTGWRRATQPIGRDGDTGLALMDVQSAALARLGSQRRHTATEVARIQAAALGYQLRGGSVRVSGVDAEAWIATLGWGSAALHGSGSESRHGSGSVSAHDPGIAPGRETGAARGPNYSPVLEVVAGCDTPGWGTPGWRLEGRGAPSADAQNVARIHVCHCRSGRFGRRVARPGIAPTTVWQGLHAGAQAGRDIRWHTFQAGASRLPLVAPLLVASLPPVASSDGSRQGVEPAGSVLRPRRAARRAAGRSTENPQNPEGAAHWTVPIGVDADGQPVAFDLIADGPHLLVAGTTGSGKSAALRSMLLGLADMHSPESLAIALVDFKGGASFGDCSRLPHVISQVTDLDVGVAERCLAGLRAELAHRKAVLADHGVGDIAELPPGVLPRLVVAFDEFRALVEDLPDAIIKLLRIAAQGRSLGIHLILATQRATGAVSPEMRANVSARLALRVVDAADSLDLIESPLAASLPAVPGRAILRLGSAAPVEVQCYWAEGAPEPVACWPASAPSVIAGSALDTAAAVIVSRAARHAQSAYPALWLPPLPMVLSGDQLPAADSGIPFGLGDQPETRTQPALAWQPSTGALAVIGGARSGRTTAVTTLAVAAANRGWAVHTLGDLGHPRHPYIGTVVPNTDPERAGRLLRALAAADPDSAPTLVVVDNIDQWRDVPAIPELIARAAARVALVLTASNASCGGLATLVGNRIVLLSTDRGEDLLLGASSDLAGKATGPGCAAWLPAGGAAPCLGQVALPESVGAGGTAGAASSPLRLEPLRGARLNDIPKPDAASTGPQLLIGLGGDLAEPVGFDPGVSALVVGPPGSGRSTVLAVIARQFAGLSPVAGEKQLAGGESVLVVSENPMLKTAAAELGAPVSLIGPELWALLRQGPPRVLVFDDLDAAIGLHGSEAEAAIMHCVDAGTTIYAAATTLNAVMAARGPLALLRAKRNGVVLHPSERGSGEVFYTQVPPPYPDPQPGRGWLVAAGAAKPTQVAQP